MTHHIYHTRGIILGSHESGESNRFYKIFTEELGLIGGTAQSIREERSKLRYALQDYSVVTLDLVLGKEVWRIISAGVHRPLCEIKKDSVRIKIFAQYCEFLQRLLQGESRDQELFEEIIRVIDFLEKEKIELELVSAFEALSLLRLLVHLGYIDPIPYKAFLGITPYEEGVLREFEKVRTLALHTIAEAMNASHL